MIRCSMTTPPMPTLRCSQTRSTRRPRRADPSNADRQGSRPVWRRGSVSD
jgi:hypothetical protein